MPCLRQGLASTSALSVAPYLNRPPADLRCEFRTFRRITGLGLAAAPMSEPMFNLNSSHVSSQPACKRSFRPIAKPAKLAAAWVMTDH